jgi:hypothetical protein
MIIFIIFNYIINYIFYSKFNYYIIKQVIFMNIFYIIKLKFKYKL